MTRRRPTRSDVAQLAGVSSAVVSYVVNDGPRPVSDEKRQRVTRAISELGYRPNRVAGALRAGRGGVVGFIVPDISNAFFADLALRFERSLAAMGLVTSICSSNADPETELAFTEALADWHASGAIFAGLRNRHSAAVLREADIPFICIDSNSADPDVTWLGIDNATEAQQAVEHLLWHRPRRVACLTGPAGELTADERLRGYQQTLQAYGVPLSSDLIIRTEYSIAGGFGAAGQLLASDVDAVFVASDVQSLGLMNGLREQGREVPHDMRIVGFDDSPIARLAYPALTLVAQPQSQLTRVCIEQLFAQEAGPACTTVAAQLRIGGSCGCTT